MKPRTIGIVSRCDTTDAIEIVEKVRKQIQGKVEVVFDPRSATELGILKCSTPIDKMHVDLIITVGGDGTILRAIQLLSKPTPILGINVGEVGFLVEVAPEKADTVIHEVLEEFEVERRTRLDISVNGEKLPPATNEAAIITSRPAKILQFQILIDENELDTIRADGLILATPTGSTAYSMSAGGPIVDPKVDAFVIVPLAPFKLSARPWVVPANSEIIVKLLRLKKEATIVIDGQYSKVVQKGDIIKFTKAEEPALFVKTGESFYSKVKGKLVT
ncbi:MAG: NAD(+) kinase [Methanocellales archaeon]|nr:NAD(+) kinase [Methanocellales archaeon]